MDLELNGRVAVVTGASKGIGLAVVRTLLDEGARVVAASRSRSAKLDALDGELLHVPADFMDADAPSEVIAGALERFGAVDVLVNNVGGPPPGTKMPQFGFLELSDGGWREMFEFNLFWAARSGTPRGGTSPAAGRRDTARARGSSRHRTAGSAPDRSHSRSRTSPPVPTAPPRRPSRAWGRGGTTERELVAARLEALLAVNQVARPRREDRELEAGYPRSN